MGVRIELDGYKKHKQKMADERVQERRELKQRTAAVSALENSMSEKVGKVLNGVEESQLLYGYSPLKPSEHAFEDPVTGRVLTLPQDLYVATAQKMVDSFGLGAEPIAVSDPIVNAKGHTTTTKVYEDYGANVQYVAEERVNTEGQLEYYSLAVRAVQPPGRVIQFKRG